MLNHRFFIRNFINVLLLFGLQACSAGQQFVQGTSTAISTPTSILTATPALTPTATEPPTATPNLAATQQTEAFSTLVQKYFDAGYIPSINGTYTRLKDYSDAYAKEGYYHAIHVGNPGSIFIVRTDVTLANARSEFPRAGCGFVYHSDQSTYDPEVLFLSQNGNVYYYYDTSYGYASSSNYYNKLSNPADVNLTMIVNQENAYFLVNDKFVIKARSTLGYGQKNFDWLMDWGFATVSSSYESFGTKCDYKNVEFWHVTQ
jgi:hypothetical protein